MGKIDKVKSDRAKEVWKNPEYRKKVSEGIKKFRAKPGVKEWFRKRMKRAFAKPGVKKKLSEAVKKWHANKKKAILNP